jgi:hypothetical protein
MKKKIYAILLATTLVLSLVACGGNDDSSKESETNNDKIEVDENLLTVELTIPSDFVGETTQEELNQTVEEEDGLKSITLNEDGSATYVMTKKKHKEMMSEIKIGIDEELQAMVGSEDYPNFTKVEANKDYTSFTITTTSTELDLVEAFSVMNFYMQGGLYNVFNGTPADNIHVDFVNATTGEIIESSDSSEIGE